MESIVQTITGDMILAPELLLAVRCIAFCTIVEALTAILSAIVPVARLGK